MDKVGSEHMEVVECILDNAFVERLMVALKVLGGPIHLGMSG